MLDSDFPHWNEYGTHSMRHTAAYFASWIGVPPETIQVLHACMVYLNTLYVAKIMLALLEPANHAWLHCCADTWKMELNSIATLLM